MKKMMNIKKIYYIFLNNGLLDHVDYYIIINGDCTVNIPEQDNIKIIKRENIGYDFGAWSHCINNYINKQYDYYIFINTSVRGPYMTQEDKNKNITWLDKFLLLFNNDDIKMVGTSINILYSNNEYPDTHIQSMFFILNNEGFNYILNLDFFNEELINSYDNISYIVFNYEVRLSQLILKNNWNINSILPIFQNIDHRKNKEYIRIRNVTNEELVFAKFSVLWYYF